MIPVVFHNLYKTVDGIAINSYCDFGYNEDELDGSNDQNICNERITRSLEVLNAQYIAAGVQFILHPDYPEILTATDLGFDGFFEDATGGNVTSPTPNSIKAYYNIPNVLNIYTHECMPSSNTSCNVSKSGFSTYPWSLDNNYHHNCTRTSNAVDVISFSRLTYDRHLSIKVSSLSIQ